MQIINPFQVYFSITGVRNGEWWRAITCFLYFGDLSTPPDELCVGVLRSYPCVVRVFYTLAISVCPPSPHRRRSKQNSPHLLSAACPLANHDACPLAHHDACPLANHDACPLANHDACPLANHDAVFPPSNHDAGSSSLYHMVHHKATVRSRQTCQPRCTPFAHTGCSSFPPFCTQDTSHRPARPARRA